jgi:hypothetical protein
MERCEKIPAETYESRNRSSVEEEPRLWPRVDREGKTLGDAEYVVPSPPEREQQSQTLSHADLEAYVRSYQNPQVSQVRVQLRLKNNTTRCLAEALRLLFAVDFFLRCSPLVYRFLVPLLGGPLSRDNVDASGSRGVYQGAAFSTGQLRAIRRLSQLRIQRGLHD